MIWLSTTSWPRKAPLDQRGNEGHKEIIRRIARRGARPI